jgi:hypothetical protein
LRADNIVAPDHRSERAAIFGLRNHIVRIARIELIGMHEISMQALRS